MRLKINFIKFPAVKFWDRLNQSIFKLSFCIFLILLLAELVEPGFVSNWFNPVWLLMIALFSGIVLVVDN